MRFGIFALCLGGGRCAQERGLDQRVTTWNKMRLAAYVVRMGEPEESYDFRYIDVIKKLHVKKCDVVIWVGFM